MSWTITPYSQACVTQVELPLTFGLGGNAGVDSLVVTWPTGETRTVPVEQVNSTLVIRQSGGS